MIAELIRKRNKVCCSNCQMEQKEINYVCWFCDCIFTNWEEFVIDANCNFILKQELLAAEGNE